MYKRTCKHDTSIVKEYYKLYATDIKLISWRGGKEEGTAAGTDFVHIVLVKVFQSKYTYYILDTADVCYKGTVIVCDSSADLSFLQHFLLHHCIKTTPIKADIC